MIELIKSIVLKMMDEKTPEENLVYVLALVIFFLLIFYMDKNTPEKFDKIFNFGKFVIVVFVIFRLLAIVFSFTSSNSENSSIEKNVNPQELIGLYKGSIQPLSAVNSELLSISFKECRLDIEDNLSCVLISENDTTEQHLGKIYSINDPVTSLLIPKLGWAKCEREQGMIKVRNDSLKNKIYYFNFYKNEN